LLVAVVLAILHVLVVAVLVVIVHSLLENQAVVAHRQGRQ
jgi:hypothetical protein